MVPVASPVFKLSSFAAGKGDSRSLLSLESSLELSLLSRDPVKMLLGDIPVFKISSQSNLREKCS